MNKLNVYPQLVGWIDEKVISLLELPIEPKPILLGKSNIEHTKCSHPDDFSKYFTYLQDILLR